MTKDQVRSTEEALKLALEALESATPKYTRQRKDQKTLGGALDYWKLGQHHRMKAITAVKQALNDAAHLAAPVQEPVAIGWDTKTDTPIMGYTTPPNVATPLAAQRPVPEERKSARSAWVGLTEDEIKLFINGHGDEDDDDYVEPTGDDFGVTDSDLVKLIRRAETKLKAKNSL